MLVIRLKIVEINRNSDKPGSSTIRTTLIASVFPRTQVEQHAIGHGEADSRPTSKIR